MKVEEIDFFPLSHTILGYHDCHACGIVDRDLERAAVGHPCGRCGAESHGAHSHFPFSVPTLIDLIQHNYHAPEHKGAGSVIAGPESHRLTVIVLFSSLTEVLLQHFLVEGLLAQGVPVASVASRLKETQFVEPRLKKLFPLVAKESWAKGLKALPLVGGMAAWDVATFCRIVAVARNRFLHQGNKWAIPDTMPLKCVQTLPPLLQMFVALHNRYVARPLVGGSTGSAA